MSDGPDVTHNPGRSRFELAVDGSVAELVYRRNGRRLVVVHTGVPAELELLHGGRS